MSKTYMISVRWIETKMNPEIIDKTVSGIGDWIRWNAFTWFVDTERSIPEIRAAILPLLKNRDSLLILEVNPAGADGWAAQWIWNWFLAKLRLRNS